MGARSCPQLVTGSLVLLRALSTLAFFAVRHSAAMQSECGVSMLRIATPSLCLQDTDLPQLATGHHQQVPSTGGTRASHARCFNAQDCGVYQRSSNRPKLGPWGVRAHDDCVSRGRHSHPSGGSMFLPLFDVISSTQSRVVRHNVRCGVSVHAW